MHQSHDIETTAQLESLFPQFPLFLVHRITANDLQGQFKQNKPFTIAWYGYPINCNNIWMIRSLASNSHSLEFEPLDAQTSRYPDLQQQIDIYKIKSCVILCYLNQPHYI